MAKTIHLAPVDRAKTLPTEKGITNGDDFSVIQFSEQEMQLEFLRRQCHSTLALCAREQESAMTEKDVEDYMRALSDSNLEAGGARTSTEKIRQLEEHRSTYIRVFVRQARSLGHKALSAIEEAKKAGWITDESAERWKRNLKDRSSSWTEARAFITQTLPEFGRNWKSVHRDFLRVQEKEKELRLTEKDIAAHEELSILHTHAFTHGKYPDRRNFVDRALALLAAWKKDAAKGNLDAGDMRALYAEAKQQLEGAVRREILAPEKMGTWLRRIFESGTKRENIRKFLNGERPMPLSELMLRWAEVRKGYDDIQNLRREKGTPQSFHFVHINVFLNWHYEARRAWVQEGKNRFTDISKERYVFLQIRNALDMKDWEDAMRFIAQAEREPMSAEDGVKLNSMKKFLREHRTGQKQAVEAKHPSDAEIISRMRTLLTENIPLSQQRLHIETLRRGPQYFRTNRILWYNRVWCHEHHYLDERKEIFMREHAAKMTPLRLKHGHSKSGVEYNDVTNPTSLTAAIRDQEETSSAQILFTNEESTGPLMQTIEEQKDNRNFWYWTSVIPEGLSFKQHHHIVKNIHPEMQHLAYEIERRGIDFTLSGPVEYRSGTLKYKHGMEPRKN